ncbi:MAG: hypothetical protein JXR83_15585 [Deltaproteobacteria bacterium]|nr:hypothetical protein [Deltaproteobacteria bacterium]
MTNTRTTMISVALALATSACPTLPPTTPATVPSVTAAADAAPVAVPAPLPSAVPDAAAAAAADPGAPKVRPAACTQVPRHLPLEQRCAMAGAVVHKFGNLCVGKCSAVEQQKMCAQAITRGCKCPAGQCIDDKTGCCRPLRR